MRHFASTRAVEVLVLQAPPILGSVRAGFIFERASVIRLGLLLVGSLALTATSLSSMIGLGIAATFLRRGGRQLYLLDAESASERSRT